MLNAKGSFEQNKMIKPNETWLMIKTGDDYGAPEFVEFENNHLIHYRLENDKENSIKKVPLNHEDITPLKIEIINNNRARIYRIGETHKFISDTETIVEKTEFATDYEKILPTKTDLSFENIQKLEYKGEWNNEKIPFVFDKNLDSPTIKAMNRRLKREGRKMVLERFENTYFASLFDQGKRNLLLGIKEVDRNKALLYGFPKTPFEIIVK